MNENATAGDLTVRVGVDIGGTFTDLVGMRSDGAVFVEKLLSSVDDYSISIATGIERILKRSGVSADRVVEVIHGTTVATNAILEGKGSLTGLITTRGFRDILDIRRSRRPDMYSLNWTKPQVLVERFLRREVTERLDSRGNVVAELVEADVLDAIEHFKAHEVKSIAVCLINSFANPAHERRIGELLREHLPSVSVSLSCDVMPRIKEYERTSTTAINAYIRPVVEKYLDGLVARLAGMGIDAPLLTMQSNGGVISAKVAAEKPIHIVESGPAAGVVGALQLAKRIGKSKAISFDMGGTTAKGALIDNGEIRQIASLEVGAGMSTFSRLTSGGGYALAAPSVDVAEVGVGGGSIAWLDEGNSIRVGPKSAGAFPGPVCYNQGGTQPTVTDANLVLGLLNPGYLAGGGLPIDIAKARAAIAGHIADPLGISVEEAAYGIAAVAVAGMTRVIRAISSERGHDPRDAVLVAFGGNGPVHAVDLARSLEMSTVIVPPKAGVFSAAGLLDTSIEHSYSKTVLCAAAPESLELLNAKLQELRREAEDDLANAGYGEVEVEWLAQADVQYHGQGSQLLLKIPAVALTAADVEALREEFHEEHKRAFSYNAPDNVVEFVSIRMTGRVALKGRRAAAAEDERADGAAGESRARTREAYFGPKYGKMQVPVMSRTELRAGPVTAPLIIEQYDTTIIVAPGAKVAIDEYDNVIIDIVAEEPAELGDVKYDSVTRELVRHALEAVADEMALTVVRTCRSNHVKHTGDFSTAIAGPDGQLLAQGLTLPLHLGALPDGLAAILEKFQGDIHEGDVFAMNDPFGGGMHLSDIYVVKPIFHEGRMVAMASAIVHQLDIGGRVAGGNSTLNTEIYAEGLRLPLLKLYDRGTLNEGVLGILRANVRMSDLVVGDVQAQLAACKLGERDYLSLVRRFGADNLARYQTQLLDTSEQIARETIRAMPDGTYDFADFMDGDSIDPDPIPIKVSITIKGDEVVVDTTGSAPQVRGAINSTYCATKSTVYTIFRSLMPAHASTNAGYMRPIHIVAEPGSILNGVLPAAGAGRAATVYRLMDATFGALAKAGTKGIMAAGDGCSIMHTIFGKQDDGKPFVFVDIMRGSWGGQPGTDGLDGTSLQLANASTVPIEIIESEFPVRVESYGYIPDTGGAGEFRGGVSVLREYRFLGQSGGTLQYRSERRKFLPYGLYGGKDGTPSVVYVENAAQGSVLPEKGEVHLGNNGLVQFCQAGGGGYGDPLKRDPEQVWRDVRDELLSRERAEAEYGVVMDPETGKLDLAATRERRECLRGKAGQVDQWTVHASTPQVVASIAAKLEAKRASGRF